MYFFALKIKLFLINYLNTLLNVKLLLPFRLPDRVLVSFHVTCKPNNEVEMSNTLSRPTSLEFNG